MTLYEIDKAITECIDTESGEIDGERLEELEIAKDEKLEGYALYIKELYGQAAMIAEEKVRLDERMKRKIGLADKLKRILAQELEGERFETSRCEVKPTRSKAVKVVDSRAIPEQYMRQRPAPDPEPDKAKIMKALKCGETVPGAELEERRSVSIK